MVLDVSTRLFQVLNFVILAGWLAMAFAALIRLRRRHLGDPHRGGTLAWRPGLLHRAAREARPETLGTR